MSDFEFTITETSSMVNLEEYLNYLIIARCNLTGKTGTITFSNRT
jgi:hypothetical protein